MTNRPTMRELSDARNIQRREEMEVAILEGRLSVRQMTSKERRQADHDRARKARVGAPRVQTLSLVSPPGGPSRDRSESGQNGAS